MILILSNKNDFTTNLVQDWLSYYGKRYVRINNQIDDINFNNEGITIKVNEEGETVNIDDIHSYWYRKGRVIKSPDTNNQLIKGEHEIIDNYLSFLLERKKSIGGFKKADTINKLIVLQVAKRNGLNIPDTYLLDNKKDLLNLLSSNKEKEYITKMKTNSSMFQFDDTATIIYTNVIKIKDLDIFPDKFAPSLIQEKIEKYFEVRTFYLHGKTWSMAIFSQNDEKTKEDYRRYNNVKPNRNTLFKLPKNIDDKLCQVMNELNLDTGSIDWMLTKDNKYYFLEVNPTGQFSNLSMTCNYPLEKIIAEKL